MWYLRDKNYFNNHPLTQSIFYSSYTIIEFLFFSFYLYKSLHTRIFRISIQFSIALFILIAFFNIYNTLKLNGKEVIDSIPIATSSIILIIFSILYLFEEIQNPKVNFIYNKSSFWIIIGIMIYFSGTFFLFLQYSDLSNTDQDNFWIINLICIILKNIFFSIAFTLSEKENQDQGFTSSIN